MMDVGYELSTDRASQVGLIVLQADETIEQDMRRLMPDKVEILVSRVPSGQHVTSESLAAMEAQLSHATSLFPAGAQFAAIAYGCTSGTAQIGAARVADAITQVAPAPHVTEPVSALIAACRQLGSRRIGLLSPYIEPVSAKLCEVLSANGITVSAFASFNESEEQRVVRISPGSIVSAAQKLAAEAEFDALFLSCTNLRTLEVIETIEAKTGTAVLTSNQVLAWHLLSLVKVDRPDGPYGRLWRSERAF